MSRIFATAGFIGVLLMSTATLRGGPAKESLRVGDLLPILTGKMWVRFGLEFHRTTSSPTRGEGEFSISTCIRTT